MKTKIRIVIEAEGDALEYLERLSKETKTPIRNVVKFLLTTEVQGKDGITIFDSEYRPVYEARTVALPSNFDSDDRVLRKRENE